MKRVLLATLLASASLATVADEGAWEINQDCAAAGCFPNDAPGFPITIGTPGHYVFTSDVSVFGGAASAVGIEVVHASSSAATVIDMKGFALDGNGGCGGFPPVTCSNAVALSAIDTGDSNRNVHIRNGSIRGFAGDAIVLGQMRAGSLIEDMRVYQNGGVGIRLAGGKLVVRDSIIAENHAEGIDATGASTAGLVVLRSELLGNGVAGIRAPDGSTINDVRFNGNDGFALVCGTCAVGNAFFWSNNGGVSATQYSVTTLRSMGAVVCGDGTCP